MAQALPIQPQPTDQDLRDVRAIHIHISVSTPDGFARVGALLQGLLTEGPQVAAVQEQQPVPIPEPQMPTQADSYCSICRTDGADATLPCGHRFHAYCIRPWLLTHRRCGDMTCGRPTQVGEMSAL